jgi:colicin import membrane protein
MRGPALDIGVPAFALLVAAFFAFAPAAERPRQDRSVPDETAVPYGGKTAVADAEGSTYEAEMLARARREAEELARSREDRSGLRPHTYPRTKSRVISVDAEEARERLAAQRAEEVRRLAEKLRRIRQAREAHLALGRGAQEEPRNPALDLEPSRAPRPAADIGSPAAKSAGANEAMMRVGAESEPRPVQLRAPHPSAAWLSEPSVTVLLVMLAGNRGIRRYNKTADPVLCVLDGCYVSSGPSRPARFLPGLRALGFANTWGDRAGACRQSLGCIFRDVYVGTGPTYLQPVDLRLIRHDRRRGQVITSDSNCRAEPGRLLCARGIHAADYSLWIVPESVAEIAGPTALQRALAEGLQALHWTGAEPTSRP